MKILLSLSLVVAACSSSPEDGSGEPGGPAVDASPGTGAEGRLEVRFLGVGGFSFRVGSDHIVTAPLYSNPSMFAVLTLETASDPEVIDQFLPAELVADASALLVGHGHYDHLMDVPHVLTRMPNAIVYANRTVQHQLAGFAPDRDEACDDEAADDLPSIARDRVVALDAPGANVVDTRMCDGLAACGPAGGQSGGWVEVPGADVRIRALCSTHPDQFLGVHFGEGCAEEDLCEPPGRAGDWLEGNTLAFLIDFLDHDSRQPRFRVYYQDAPADAPIGFAHDELLAEKRVDVAVLNVGNYEEVTDHPNAIIGNLSPRYALGGHWENFFQTQALPVEPIPLQPGPAEFMTRMASALGEAAEKPMHVDGRAEPIRHWLPDPGAVLEYDAE